MVAAPARLALRLIVRCPDYPGKWMFPCHIMDHEDQGMMGILDVH